jgi:acetolactate synthase-1/2/3 large subunit
MNTLSETVVDFLAQSGVTAAYTVPGESFLGLLDAFDAHEGVDLVSTRHEGGAAFMAAAAAAITQVPAVVLGSRGPGATNLSIGVHTAMQDATPMIVLLGQVSTGFLGREAFQEVDLEAMFRPLAKWSATAFSKEDVLPLVEQAWVQATSGRPGPAVLVIPTDLLDFVNFEGQYPAAAEPSTLEPNAGLISQCATELAEAKRPVLVIGRGTRPNDPAVIEVAQKFGAGVYVAFRCQDRFPVDHPNFLGHLGLGLQPEIRDALRDSDLVLTLGTRWDEVTSQDFTLPQADTRQFHIGAFAATTEHPWIGPDVDAVLAALLRQAPAQLSTRDWSAAHAVVSGWMTIDENIASSEGMVHPARVVSIMREMLPEDCIITNDAGNFASFLHRYWNFGPGVAQLGTCSGAMGYAIPAAIAAAQHEPARTAVAVVGDGGALMTGNELEVAARNGWNPIVVVFQNNIYGTIAMHQLKEVGRTTAIDIGAVKFASWAEGLGATGYSVDDENDLREALKHALASEGPSVVAVRTDPRVITPTLTIAEPLNNF